MNIDKVRAVIERYIKTDLSWASEYGEPGYSKEFPNQPILFANWNDVPEHVMKWLEHRYNTEWSDEWVTDERHYAYRCHGDSYFWTRYYVENAEGEIIGGDLIEENESDREWYVNECLLNNPSMICGFDIDLVAMGFIKVNDNSFENGLHPGMNDDPEAILKIAKQKYPDCDFVFSNLKPSQFYSEFDLYRRPKETEEEAEEESNE